MGLFIPSAGTTGIALPCYTCKDRWTGSGSSSTQERSRRQETLQRTLIIPYTQESSTWRNYLPEDGAPLPEAPWLQLSKYSLNQNEADPLRATLVLTYEQFLPQFSAAGAGSDPENNPFGQGDPAQGEYNFTFPDLPENYTEENVARVDLPIQSHQNWDLPLDELSGQSMSEVWDDEQQAFPKTLDAPFPGLQSYITGSLTVTSHTFSWGRPASPSEYVGLVGAPPGYTEPNNWLITTGYRSRESGYWRRSMVYLYSETEYPDWLYGRV